MGIWPADGLPLAARLVPGLEPRAVVLGVRPRPAGLLVAGVSYDAEGIARYNRRAAYWRRHPVLRQVVIAAASLVLLPLELAVDLFEETKSACTNLRYRWRETFRSAASVWRGDP